VFDVRVPARPCALILLVLVLSGCVANPNKQFSDYDADRFGSRPVLLVVDTLLMDDVEGEEHIVNLAVNRQARADLIAAVGELLRSKGYRLAEHPVQSFGLTVGDSTRLRVLEEGSKSDGRTAWSDSDQVEVDWTPIEVDAGSLVALPETELLSRTHQRLFRTPVNDLKIVGEIGLRGVGADDYSGIILIQAVGVQVPFGKSFGQGMLTGLLTLGTVAMWQQSNTEIRVSLIEPQTDRVVWANRVAIAAPVRKTEEIQQQINLLLEKLPDTASPSLSAP